MHQLACLFLRYFLSQIFWLIVLSCFFQESLDLDTVEPTALQLSARTPSTSAVPVPWLLSVCDCLTVAFTIKFSTSILLLFFLQVKGRAMARPYASSFPKCPPWPWLLSRAKSRSQDSKQVSQGDGRDPSHRLQERRLALGKEPGLVPGPLLWPAGAPPQVTSQPWCLSTTPWPPVLILPLKSAYRPLSLLRTGMAPSSPTQCSIHRDVLPHPLPPPVPLLFLI